MKFSLSRAFYYAVRLTFTKALLVGVLLGLIIGVTSGNGRNMVGAIVLTMWVAFYGRLIWEVFRTEPPDA
jgi:hypothetical protein